MARFARLDACWPPGLSCLLAVVLATVARLFTQLRLLPLVLLLLLPLLVLLLLWLPVAPRTAVSLTAAAEVPALRCCGSALLVALTPAGRLRDAVLFWLLADTDAATMFLRAGNLAALGGASCCSWSTACCMRWSSCCSSASKLASSRDSREGWRCCCCRFVLPG